MYIFFHKNLKFPEISSLKTFMSQILPTIEENNLHFDELKNYLTVHNYPMEIQLFEDGTKIVEKVEYCPRSNALLGLDAPFNPITGLPTKNFHKAITAKNIFQSLKNYSKASYVQVILAQPNARGAKPFLLSLYFTSNKFSANDVNNRMKYIKQELNNRGICLIAFGSDGDTRLMSAQKNLINFGQYTRFGSLELCGDINSECLGNQDAFHIMKRLKNLLYDLGRSMEIGINKITVNHLIIMFKNYDKSRHGLVQSDLDITDRMNYDCLYKITSSKVLRCLNEMEGTKGTVVYIELIKCGLEAFVNPETVLSDRIFNAIYMLSFIRLWRGHIIDKKLSMERFITQNCFEGIEMDCLLIIKLILDNRGENISENSSQQCESFFRRIRSLTGVESTIVNCTPKLLI